MTSNNQNLPNGMDDLNETSTIEENSKGQPEKSSATTPDFPSFGWSSYAERINGRFAMIGLMAVLLVEALNKISFLEWAGIITR